MRDRSDADTVSLTLQQGDAAGMTAEERLAADACAREEIQFLGGVQDFGCLLVLSNDWIVQNASANCGDIIGIDAERLVAARLIDVFPPDAMHLLRGKAQMIGRGDEGVGIFGCALFGDERLFDIALHRCGGNFLFDFERAAPGRRTNDPSIPMALLSRIQAAEDVEAMCEIAANGIWAMTGFDRVMIYRFEPDFSGVVVAEALGAGATSYLGHRFPASDIPPQARALYTRNLQRIIADVDGPVHPLIPERTLGGKPVDLSLSVTRAVSPIHLQYLRNMGVAASMSVSILREGKLWGMVACHHPKPLYVDYEIRSSVELFCRLLSYELALADAAGQQAQADRAFALHEQISMQGASGTNLQDDREMLAQGLARVIPLDGMAMMIDGRYDTQGLAPTEDEFHALVSLLARSGEGQVFATDQLAASFPGAVAPERQIGGLLAIPIRRQPAEYVILLRREVARDIIWAGPPDKPVQADGRLSPRQSFDTWRELVHGHCRPWQPGDLRAAEILRVTLLELVLKQASDTSNRDRDRNDQQEVVIAELNHRLRNIFGLVAGLISRGSEGVAGVQSFSQELHARVAALARAHDMLTDSSDHTRTLRDVVLNEARAYAGGGERVRFVGGDALLSQQVRATAALVLHELTTNAAKYGALSGDVGHVEVSMSRGPRGDLLLTWTERDGPKVRPPGRSGFGNTLLARAIPHELGGTAELDFAPDGLVARFTIPARHLVRFDATPAERVRDTDDPANPDASTLGPGDGVAATGRLVGRPLVIEDNLLIAMNAADALRALGAEDVSIVGSIPAALDRIEQGGIDLAILDLDLGGVLSLPVAQALRKAQIPFLLATGYDANARDEPEVFRNVLRLRKPYSNEAIAGALAAAGLLTPGA